MGVVYHAHQSQPIRRDLALKRVEHVTDVSQASGGEIMVGAEEMYERSQREALVWLEHNA